MITIGDFKITLHNFGFFRLDGGAMFGSVPKNLWNKRIKADEENCIPLATRSMLIRHKDRVFLTDVGLGEKWTDKQRQIFAIKNTPIDQLGFNQSEVTDIILTHLHFDHAGGISRHKTNYADLELLYPNATVHLQKQNFENATNPNLRERASYLPENVRVLEKAKLNLLHGDTEIYPGICVHQVNGHTVGQQWIEIKVGSESIVYPTDLVPTSHHMPVPYNMGYDLCADTVMKEKETFGSYALSCNALVVFQHDPEIAAAKICKDEKGHYAIRADTIIKG